MPSETPALRLGVLGIIGVSLLATLVGRLWYLQVMAAPTFEQAVTSNQVRSVVVPPMRGRILDRNGVVLAGNRRSTVVTVDRTQIRSAKKRATLFNRLAPVLGTTPEKLEGRYDDAQYQRFAALPLAEDVDERVAIFLNERVEDYPGIDVAEEPVRTYPYGALAAHLLGYVGRIPADAADRYTSEGYQLSDIVGLNGVERIFEKDLRGTPGKVVFEVDAAGRVVAERSHVDPKPGNDVVLTIDARVQLLAEQTLNDGLVAMRSRKPKPSPNDPTYDPNETFAAPAGSIVVQDPNDGSLLALASNPTYDPRRFVDGIPKARFEQLYGEGTDNPLLDRAIQGQYPPGSTFKVVTALAGMKAGAISGDTVVDDTGVYTVPDCTGECRFRNAGSAGLGPVNLPQALASSSDFYFYKLGHDLWRYSKGNVVQDEAELLGFGAVTGVQLPNEQDGWVPTPERKKQRHQDNPSAFIEGRWFPGDAVNTAVGQGDVLVTPLQLANAYSTIANGGTLWSPNVVSRVETTADDGSVEVLRRIDARKLTDVELGTGSRLYLLGGLIDAVGGNRGTAFPAFEGFPLDRFKVAGKTGTAQDQTKKSVNDFSLFASFAPVTEPKYTVTVVMEKSGFGSQAAAPVARRIYEGLFGIHPLPELEEAPAPDALPDRAVDVFHLPSDAGLVLPKQDTVD